jgi:hypothetical protein
MATKRKPTKKPEPAIEEEVVGPAETTVDKGPDEKFWRCPHCATFYKKEMVIARENHLARVHPGQ